MEQEIKELHTGLGAVVQALNFLQTFLESDYGLKYQFHAYCNSPLYSHNSDVLEILKQKYPGNVQESCFNGNDRLYQAGQHGSSSDNNTLVHIRYPGQETIQGIEQTNLNAVAVASVCSTSLDQNFSNSDHSRHHTPSAISSVEESLNSSQRSIIVNEDELFAISDHLATMKEESNEIFQPDEGEIDTFSKTGLGDENDSNEEIVNIESPIINEVTTKKPLANKRSRAKKRVIVEHYKCPHCRRKCEDRAKLDLHMTHHKQQFQCSQCGIWLADKSVLNRHMRTHTGDRPFKCAFCKESFSRQDIVKKHIQRKHKGMVENSQSRISN